MILLINCPSHVYFFPDDSGRHLFIIETSTRVRHTLGAHLEDIYAEMSPVTTAAVTRSLVEEFDIGMRSSGISMSNAQMVMRYFNEQLATRRSAISSTRREFNIIPK